MIFTRISTPQQLSIPQLASELKHELLKKGYDCGVGQEDNRIHLSDCRLSESYVEKHGYNLSPYTGRRGRILNWDNWVEVNNSINDILDEKKVSADISSLKGKFRLREGAKRFAEIYSVLDCDGSCSGDIFIRIGNVTNWSDYTLINSSSVRTDGNTTNYTWYNRTINVGKQYGDFFFVQLLIYNGTGTIRFFMDEAGPRGPKPQFRAGSNGNGSDVGWSLDNGDYAINITTISEYYNVSYNFSGEYTSPVLDSGVESKWLNISWFEDAPYGEELPNFGGIETIENGANMTGNTLLMHFDNNSDFSENNTYFYDFSGFGNNCTCSGSSCPVYTQNGKFNKALSFDGVNDYLISENNTALSGTNVTIIVWVNWSGGSGSYEPIVTQSDSSYIGYYFYIYATQPNKLCFWLDDTETCTNVSFPRNEEHFVAGSHNDTHLMVYFDGKLINSAVKNGSGINKRTVIGFDDIDDYFNGTLDEIAIFGNRTLSPVEINNLYRRGLELRFQARSDDDNSSWGSFTGPDGTVSTYYNNASSINVSNNRYFQYRAYLVGGDSVTPLLYNTSVSYSRYDTYGTVETEFFNPANITRWINYTHTEYMQSGTGISYQYDINDGNGWISVPIDGNISGLNISTSKIKFRSVLTTSVYGTPSVYSMLMFYEPRYSKYNVTFMVYETINMTEIGPWSILCYNSSGIYINYTSVSNPSTYLMDVDNYTCYFGVSNYKVQEISLNVDYKKDVSVYLMPQSFAPGLIYIATSNLESIRGYNMTTNQTIPRSYSIIVYLDEDTINVTECSVTNAYLYGCNRDGRQLNISYFAYSGEQKISIKWEIPHCTNSSMIEAPQYYVSAFYNPALETQYNVTFTFETIQNIQYVMDSLGNFYNFSGGSLQVYVPEMTSGESKVMYFFRKAVVPPQPPVGGGGGGGGGFGTFYPIMIKSNLHAVTVNIYQNGNLLDTKQIRTDTPFILSIGKYTFEFTHDGYKPLRIDVSLSKPTSIDVYLELLEGATPEEPVPRRITQIQIGDVPTSLYYVIIIASLVILLFSLNKSGREHAYYG